MVTDVFILSKGQIFGEISLLTGNDAALDLPKKYISAKSVDGKTNFMTKRSIKTFSHELRQHVLGAENMRPKRAASACKKHIQIIKISSFFIKNQ